MTIGKLKFPVCDLPITAIATPTIANPAAVIRNPVTAFGPAGPSPYLSTNSDAQD